MVSMIKLIFLLFFNSDFLLNVILLLGWGSMKGPRVHTNGWQNEWDQGTECEKHEVYIKKNYRTLAGYQITGNLGSKKKII